MFWVEECDSLACNDLDLDEATRSLKRTSRLAEPSGASTRCGPGTDSGPAVILTLEKIPRKTERRKVERRAREKSKG
jgi:hypothetical protein